MKRLFVMAGSCLILQVAMAQKTEFSMGINGTASFFRGMSAASTTTMYISDVPGAVPNVTADYYGKKPGRGAAGELVLQRLNKKRIITGLSAGYEVLKSRVEITKVSSRISTPAEGSTKLTHTFINFFPYIGKRFGGDKFAVDLILGLDVGLPLSAHEKGEAQTSDGTIFTTRTDHSKPSVDLRPRFQLKLKKSHFGLQTSFSFGLTEYYGKMYGGNPEAYSNVFRIGAFHVL